jgi:hypothetical protein
MRNDSGKQKSLQVFPYCWRKCVAFSWISSMLELDAHSQQTKFKQLIKMIVASRIPEIRSVQRNGAE